MANSKAQNRAVLFLEDLLRGVAIGAAFIIPGFSGGSVAAILGIYERLIDAITGIRHLKKSLPILVPVLLGMLIGVAALIFPIRFGLARFPIQTVSLFVGLALGGLFSIAEKTKGKKDPRCFFALLFALLFAAALCFLPPSQKVDLFSLDALGYLLLIPIGAIGACALVIPGISGSMLLFIFGYYEPVVSLITEHLILGDSLGICALVLSLLLFGVLLGFFGISHLMKFLLKKFPRGSYFAIVGFILGSVPAVYVSTLRQSAAAISLPQILFGAAFLLLGFLLSAGFVFLSKAKKSE